jgi:hypothetical protein
VPRSVTKKSNDYSGIADGGLRATSRPARIAREFPYSRQEARWLCICKSEEFLGANCAPTQRGDVQAVTSFGAM